MDKKKKRKHIEYGRYGYFFIAPFFIAYCLFQLWPLFNTCLLYTSDAADER
mgnify:CR=1 FL=1